MSDGPTNRVRCEEHGLIYDPTVDSGCIVCRRGQTPSEPTANGLPSKATVALVMSLSVLVLGGLVGGIYVYFDRLQARIEADGPTEPEVGQVVAALPGIPGHKGTIMLGRKGTDEYRYPKDLPDKLTLLSLLREKRFEELSAHIESFQSAFEEDFRNEWWIAVAMGAFSTADRDIGNAIDHWVEATPNSFAPYLARAEHKISLAWHYRGGKWGYLTSKKRFKKMRKILQPAAADVERALELHPDLVEAWSTRLRLATGFNADVVTKTKILEDGLRHCPYCFGIRGTYLMKIEPRWGGSYELMERKAADWQYTDKNPKLRQLLGFADLDRCQLLAEKKPHKALGYCNRALDHGAHAAFLSAKGVALTELERYDDAVDMFSQALDILPQSVRSLNGRGYAFFKAERYDEAARDYVLATRLDPVNGHAERNLHHILAMLVRAAYEKGEAGKIDEAIVEYTRVLQMHPRYAHAFLYRGLAYDREGELELAEQDYLKAIELEPTNVEGYRGLDHVLFQQKRLDEIVEYWTRYLKLRPKDATALYERSGTYHRKGESELAKRDVSAACRLGNQKACETEKRFYPSR